MKINVLLYLLISSIFCTAKTMIVDKQFIYGLYEDVDTVIINCNIDTFKIKVIKSFPNVECYLCSNATYFSNKGILYKKNKKCIYLVPANYHFHDDKYKCCSKIQSISADAFFKCKNLHEIDLNKVKYIGVSSFNSCENLLKIKFGKKIITIDTTAFDNCRKLKSVYIQRVDSIKHAAFYRCIGLKELYIHSSNYIGPICFYCSKNLYKILLPKCIYDAEIFPKEMSHLQCLYMEGKPLYPEYLWHRHIVSCIPSNSVLFVKKEDIFDFQKQTVFSQFDKIKVYKDISFKIFENIKVKNSAELKCFYDD